MLLPYDRGDLVSRVHEAGEVLASEHLVEGTRLTARVGAELADDLTPYRGLTRLSAEAHAEPVRE